VQPALAQEIDDDAEELSLFAKMLGAAGLLAIPGPGIEYKERPALVVPPSVTHVQPSAQPQLQSHAQPQPDPWNFSNPMQNLTAAPTPAPAPVPNQALVLPPPADPNAIRQTNPDFPVDPEVRAAQKANAARKKKGPRLIANDPFYGGRLLRADEMKTRGPRGTPQNVDAQGKDGPDRSPSREFEVPVFSSFFGKKKEEQVQFTGEEPRQSLTQPPAGYLTPSANAPYGVVGRDDQEKQRPNVHPNMPDAPIPQTR
jgi:hypothetical protein